MALVLGVVTENRPRASRIDEFFDLLSNKHRRETIHVLVRRDEPISVERLAERLATREWNDPSHDDVRKIHISLQHAHLPKLADAEVVAYDSDTQRVEFANSRPLELGWQEARSWFDNVRDSSSKRSETP